MLTLARAEEPNPPSREPSPPFSFTLTLALVVYSFLWAGKAKGADAPDNFPMPNPFRDTRIEVPIMAKHMKKAEIQAPVLEPLAPLTRKLYAKELTKLHVALVKLPDRTKLDRYQSPDYPF